MSHIASQSTGIFAHDRDYFHGQCWRFLPHYHPDKSLGANEVSFVLETLNIDIRARRLNENSYKVAASISGCFNRQVTLFSRKEISAQEITTCKEDLDFYAEGIRQMLEADRTAQKDKLRELKIRHKISLSLHDYGQLFAKALRKAFNPATARPDQETNKRLEAIAAKYKLETLKL